MRAKKGRGAKVLPAPPDGSQTASFDSANLSAIERESFMEGLQQDHGNPLHSTAVEEDLNVLEEAQMDGKNIPKATKGRVKAKPDKEGVTAKQKGATEADKGQVNAERKESDKSNQAIPTTSGLKRLVGKKPASRSVRQTSAARPTENQQMKKKNKRESGSSSGRSSDAQSQEESDSGTGVRKRRHKVLSSDEEVEDTSWKPSPKKARVYSLGKTRKSSSGRAKSRKSSSGSASAGPEERKKKIVQGGTELEVALEAFLDFCDQYRDSVESKAVKQSIELFSNNVEEHLLEKISSYKDFKVLKRGNTKVAALIRTNTQRLLDAKQGLMRAERQQWLLQKEEAELKLRLADLQLSQSFLRDIGELNRVYLDDRRTHPKEKETYGASSLPALLLETKRIQRTEQELKGINNQLEKRLKGGGK